MQRMHQHYVLMALLALLAGCAQKTAMVIKPEPAPAVQQQLAAPAPVLETAIAPLPDFAAMKVADRKRGFINLLRPIIRAENESIEAQRARLLALNPNILTAADGLWLNELAEEYGLKPGSSTPILIKALTKRVDVVPEWLALMQAANESAWGTSRFVREGNNFFGQWCFSKGCGIVPSRRAKGATHEVAAFKSPAESVRAYMHNLNTGRAYRYLRKIRTGLRRQGKPLTAEVLAAGLDHYSERGHAYVEDLRRMIRVNRGA